MPPPLSKDIDPNKPSVYDTYDVEEGFVPQGAQRRTIKLPSGQELDFYGTGEWTDDGKGTHKSCGIITVELSKHMSLPLSIVGLVVKESPFSLTVPEEGSCKDSALREDELQQLAVASALPRTFLREVRNGLPDWISLAPNDATTSDTSAASDTAIALHRGSAVKNVPNCNVSQAVPPRLFFFFSKWQ